MAFDKPTLFSIYFDWSVSIKAARCTACGHQAQFPRAVDGEDVDGEWPRLLDKKKGEIERGFEAGTIGTVADVDELIRPWLKCSRCGAKAAVLDRYTAEEVLELEERAKSPEERREEADAKALAEAIERGERGFWANEGPTEFRNSGRRAYDPSSGRHSTPYFTRDE